VAAAILLRAAAPAGPTPAPKGTYKGCQAWVWETRKGRSIDVNTNPFAKPEVLEATRPGEDLVRLRVRFKRNAGAAAGDCGDVDCGGVRLIGASGEEDSPIKAESQTDSCQHPVHFDNKGIEGFPSFYFSVPEGTDLKNTHLKLGTERLLVKK
jgi:hypothetical protein